MKTALQCYKIFEKLVNTMDIGHSWLHTNMSVKDMNIRMNVEHKQRISSIDLSQDDLCEQMLFCAEDNAELIQEWLYHNPKRREEFHLVCEKPIGTVLYNKDWCNKNVGVKCSDLIVILTKIEEKDGDLSFKITTAYCDLTDEERKKIKGAV